MLLPPISVIAYRVTRANHKILERFLCFLRPNFAFVSEPESVSQPNSPDTGGNTTSVSETPTLNEGTGANMSRLEDEPARVSLLASEPVANEHSGAVSTEPPPYEPPDPNRPAPPYECSGVNTPPLAGDPTGVNDMTDSSATMAASAIPAAYTSRSMQLAAWSPTSMYPPMRQTVTRDTGGDSDTEAPSTHIGDMRMQPMGRLFAILFICGFIGGGLVSLSLQNR